jgi:hypothetical protein
VILWLQREIGCVSLEGCCCDDFVALGMVIIAMVWVLFCEFAGWWFVEFWIDLRWTVVATMEVLRWIEACSGGVNGEKVMIEIEAIVVR